MKCQECNKNPAKWHLYKTYPDGHKEWIWVCKECEGKLGDANMKLAGGRYE